MSETQHIPPARRLPDVNELVAGVRAGNRTMLARAITLVESRLPRHEVTAQELLQKLLPFTGQARRVGITGSPGVGKSTFIESFGCYLVDQNHQVAVLTIDPTSTRSHGSILGDKTRMEKLCVSPRAFIRPSPSGEHLGGVARRTRETMLLCEAAGFDVIVIETVGVGQSEIALRSMTDFFLLLLLPGSGDELQGIKKGIVEMADLVVINKADGENRMRAEATRMDQANALHYQQPATPGWTTEALLCSGRDGVGVPEVWANIEKFYTKLPAGVIADLRRQQAQAWFRDLIDEELRRRFYNDPQVMIRLDETRQALLEGQITAVQAAQALFRAAEFSATRFNPEPAKN
jgi:LAO/AO transport system kinase